jgi:glycerol-3-phosphate cytidylyltransferase
VKGSTYKIEDLPEVPLIKEQGGEIRILPVLRDYSTLGILQKIARS